MLLQCQMETGSILLEACYPLSWDLAASCLCLRALWKAEFKSNEGGYVMEKYLNS